MARIMRSCLVLLFFCVIGYGADELKIKVLRHAGRDELFEQGGCPENSDETIRKPENEGRVNCTCYSTETTVMTKDKQEYQCSKSSDVGCTLKLNNSVQAYPIPTPGAGELQVEIKPQLSGNAKIERIDIWNLKDLRTVEGLWTEATKEGRMVFSLTGSTLKIAPEHKEWDGHVVKISFGDSKCVVAKFLGMPDDYPFNITEWRKQFVYPTTKAFVMPTHAAQHQDPNSNVAAMVLVPFFIALLAVAGCYVAYGAYRKKMRKDNKPPVAENVVEPEPI